MFKKFTQLFQSNQKSSLRDTILKSSIISQELYFNQGDVQIIINKFREASSQGTNQLKQLIKEFLDLMDDTDVKLDHIVARLKILIAVHILIQNPVIGRQFSTQLLKKRFDFYKKFNQETGQFSIWLSENILIPYYSYLFRLASNWDQVFQYSDEIKSILLSDENLIYFTYSNLANLGISIFPKLRLVDQKQEISQLLRYVSLQLFGDIDKFYRRILKRVSQQLYLLDQLNCKVIEINELYQELCTLEKQMLLFYSFICHYHQSKSYLPPMSLNFPQSLLHQLKSSASKESGNQNKNSQTSLKKNLKLPDYEPKIPKIINTAKNTTATFKLNLENIERPDKEIHTHRHEKRTIDFEKFKTPIEEVQIWEENTQKDQDVDEDPPLNDNFMNYEEDTNQNFQQKSKEDQ